MKTTRWLLLAVMAACFMFGFAAGQAYAAEESCIRSFEVRPRTMLRMRRYDIHARVRIEPHAHHRGFAVRYTSDVGAEGGSMRQLEGDRAAVTQDSLWWKEHPGGQYAFDLTVYGPGGRAVSRRRVDIHAPEP